MSKLYDKAADAVKKRNYDYAIDLLIQLIGAMRA